MQARRGNFFSLPNEIFLLGLSPGELSVYSYLLCCADRKTGQCWPSYQTIARATHMSRNTVRKYVCSLADKGLITTEGTDVLTKNGVKRNGNLRYTVRPIQQVMEEFYQRQLDNEGRLPARHTAAGEAQGLPAGIPGETQRSGFAGERRRNAANEPCRLRQGERCEVCADEGQA